MFDLNLGNSLTSIDVTPEQIEDIEAQLVMSVAKSIHDIHPRATIREVNVSVDGSHVEFVVNVPMEPKDIHFDIVLGEHEDELSLDIFYDTAPLRQVRRLEPDESQYCYHNEYGNEKIFHNEEAWARWCDRMGIER